MPHLLEDTPATSTHFWYSQESKLNKMNTDGRDRRFWACSPHMPLSAVSCWDLTELRGKLTLLPPQATGEVVEEGHSNSAPARAETCGIGGETKQAVQV